MKKIIGLAVLIAIVFFACKKNKSFTKPKISGICQKGPLVNGSSLTLFELNESFSQTGRSFNTQILDNLGSFEIDNIAIQTSSAILKADGFYFNEITNSISTAPISLYALSDLTDKSTVNVNLLSTLEISRAEFLIDNGITFNNAKHQAQQEILNMFFINKPTMTESELLNIAVNEDDNAILLAISLILQGYRTESELTQLLGDISTDIRTDGILNSPSLGSALINGAKLFDTIQIRSNIENKYTSLGIATVIPHFEHYIKQFLDSCTYTFTNYITFPANGTYGINLLNTTDSVFTQGINYSFCANLPEGTHLKIMQNGNNGILSYVLGSLNGWTDLGPDNTYVWRTFVSNRSGFIDFHAIPGPGTVNIFFYENNSVNPTRIKNIYIQ